MPWPTAQAREPAVIVPGGGWAAQPGQMEEAKAGGQCLIIYLKCSASTAARRSERGEVRPLLAGAEPDRADPEPPPGPGTVLPAR